MPRNGSRSESCGGDGNHRRCRLIEQASIDEMEDDMNDRIRAQDLNSVYVSLEALQQRLLSSAVTLDSIATNLENAHLDSPDPAVLQMQQEAHSLIEKIRLAAARQK